MLKEKSRDTKQDWLLRDIVNDPTLIMVKFFILYIAQLETIKMLISLAAQNKWKIYQMDVKSTFLNGILEE
jgi:hypothetical protein